jgi:potassium channel subfamily K, other eukaryote
MAPFLPASAFLARFFPSGDTPPERSLESGLHDPEKGSSQDDEEHHYDDNQEEVEELDDFEDLQQDVDEGEGQQDEHQPREGVPLTPTATFSSSSVVRFSRPSLPKWLIKTKDVLFASHEEHGQILPNYRRAPIISGSLIPFSILLEIPGLTEPWYIRTYGPQNAETRKDLPLVLISISVSMALAVIANIALIFRFLERHVKRNTIICIVTLTLHGESLFLGFLNDINILLQIS